MCVRCEHLCYTVCVYIYIIIINIVGETDGMAGIPCSLTQHMPVPAITGSEIFKFIKIMPVRWSGRKKIGLHLLQFIGSL